MVNAVSDVTLWDERSIWISTRELLREPVRWDLRPLIKSYAGCRRQCRGRNKRIGDLKSQIITSYSRAARPYLTPESS